MSSLKAAHEAKLLFKKQLTNFKMGFLTDYTFFSSLDRLLFGNSVINGNYPNRKSINQLNLFVPSHHRVNKNKGLAPASGHTCVALGGVSLSDYCLLQPFFVII